MKLKQILRAAVLSGSVVAMPSFAYAALGDMQAPPHTAPMSPPPTENLPERLANKVPIDYTNGVSEKEACQMIYDNHFLTEVLVETMTKTAMQADNLNAGDAFPNYAEIDRRIPECDLEAQRQPFCEGFTYTLNILATAKVVPARFQEMTEQERNQSDDYRAYMDENMNFYLFFSENEKQRATTEERQKIVALQEGFGCPLDSGPN